MPKRSTGFIISRKMHTEILEYGAIASISKPELLRRLFEKGSNLYLYGSDRRGLLLPPYHKDCTICLDEFDYARAEELQSRHNISAGELFRRILAAALYDLNSS